jgi:hypothetical protein
MASIGEQQKVVLEKPKRSGLFLCYVFENRRQSVFEFFLSYKGIEDHEERFTFFIGQPFTSGRTSTGRREKNSPRRFKIIFFKEFSFRTCASARRNGGEVRGHAGRSIVAS